MKKLLTFLSLSLSLSLVKADYWTQKANFPSFGRECPYSFAIGIYGYAGGGEGEHDLWKYDPAGNTWIQMASVPPNFHRRASVGFSINNKGYMGLGAHGSLVHNDFWEYDPVLNAWTQKANFGGGAREFASAFTIGNNGYAGAGGFADFWEWDQTTNIWTQVASLPAQRIAAVGFSINNKGYISTGYCCGSNQNDIWEYDPALNNWVQKTSIPAIGRVDATGFSICGKGYLGTGGEVPRLNDFWQFDPVLNLWNQKTNVGGPPRDDATSFVIGNKGYLGFGQDSNDVNLSDFWEYTPDSACATGIEEEFSTSNLEFSFSPNPAKEFIVINYLLTGKENVSITITNVEGKKVYESKLLTSDFRLPTSSFQKGIYFVELSNGKQKAVKKFIKE